MRTVLPTLAAGTMFKQYGTHISSAVTYLYILAQAGLVLASSSTYCTRAYVIRVSVSAMVCALGHRCLWEALKEVWEARSSC